MANPHYCILIIKKQRGDNLSKVDQHNARSVPTPNADMSMVDGVRILRFRGNSTSEAVAKRVAQAGAKLPSHNCYVAFEVIVSLSPNAPLAPSDEVFSARSLAFLDAEFGTENVVSVWFHRDEKSPHIHAIVVPIAEGLPRGRPTFGAAPKVVSVVSWNRFSGSYKRMMRKGAGPVEAHNTTMKAWQTHWAHVWSDHDYRRGIPCKRTVLPIKDVQMQTAAIHDMAGMAQVDFIRGIEALKVDPSLSPEAGLKVVIEQTKTLIQASFVGVIQPLVELASRGVQLEVERESRAELGDRNQRLDAELSDALKANVALHQEARDLGVHVQELKDENESLKCSINMRKDGVVADWVDEMTDSELREWVLAELGRREQDRRGPHGHQTRPPLSDPGISPNPSGAPSH
ncbi:MAG: plasmid recombination protein [Opitutus sp.]|nr:plasmid recombination protein [Opitutus sp.]MCS6248670.1 plasmid recombination protein [Opitutus sp.]MCS6275510.1 plasmid recombination protein [Opitutus sp.]MCS6299467.1 plasmid recombination protein [Opitutus sp.]